MTKHKIEKLVLMKRHLRGSHDNGTGVHYTRNGEKIECPLCRDEVEK